MIRSRALSALFASAIAVSLAAFLAPAAHADIFKTTRLTDVLVTGSIGGPQNDLPAPPANLAATPRRDAGQGSGQVDPVDLPYVAGPGSPSSGKVQRVRIALPDTRDPIAKQKPGFVSR